MAGLTPIVRALLNEDYESALERLRPLSDWGSALGPLMREYIARMRSLGYRYEARARELRRFDRFLQRRPILRDSRSRRSRGLASTSSGPRHRLLAQQCARTLTQALRRHDERPDPADRGGAAAARCRAERKPHLFTEAEIPTVVPGGAHVLRAQHTHSTDDGLRDADARVLRGPAARRDRGAQAGRSRSRRSPDRDPRNQVLQIPAPAACAERHAGPVAVPRGAPGG